MRKWVGFLLIALIAVGALAALAVPKWLGRRLEIKAYFQDVQGLRPGAPVRLAGVNIGTVTDVRARPEVRERPAEVVMVIHTKYKLAIPNDAVVSLSTAGVLGETCAEIEVINAKGAPAGNRAVLQTRESQKLSVPELLDRIADLMKQKGCDPAKEPLSKQRP